MEIRCCFCDMDGTLLNSNNQLDAETISALLALKDRGIRLVLATGRSDLQIREHLSVLQIDTPIITCNGGVVKDPCTGEVLSAKFFDAEDAKLLIDHCTARGYDFLLYTPQFVYYSEGSTRIQKYVNYNKTAEPRFHVPMRPISEFTNADLTQVVKCLVTDDLSVMEDLEKSVNPNGKLSIVSSGDRLMDIMHGHTTSKGEAVRVVCDRLGISPEHAICFGDSPNDLTMFETVGFAVAMGNATDEVKCAADFVTETNDNLGVVRALEYIFKAPTL